MAIPAILAALGRASSAAGTLARGGAGAPPPLPGASGRGFFEGTQKIQAFTDQAGKMASTIGQLTPSFKGFVGALTAFPNKILSVRNELVAVGQSYVQALAAPITGIKELGDSLAVFTRLSNPSQFKRFTYTVENTFATLGKTFEGPMEGLIRAARTVGDTFAKLKPALAPAMQAVEMFTDTMAQNFVTGAKTWAPVLQGLGFAMLGLAKVTEMASKPLRALHGIIQRLSQTFGLGAMLGMPAWDENAKSNVAVREPRYLSSQEIAREMAQNALMAGAGQPKEKPETVAILSLPEILNNIYKLIQRRLGPEAVIELATAIASAILSASPAGQAAKVANRKLDDAAERIANWLIRQGLL